MPFVPSSDADFVATPTAFRTNRVAEQNVGNNQQAHVDEFVAYQGRADIESRTSILEREQAQPGSILWEAQTRQHEVDVVVDPTA